MKRHEQQINRLETFSSYSWGSSFPKLIHNFHAKDGRILYITLVIMFTAVFPLLAFPDENGKMITRLCWDKNGSHFVPEYKQGMKFSAEVSSTDRTPDGEGVLKISIQEDCGKASETARQIFFMPKITGKKGTVYRVNFYIRSTIPGLLRCFLYRNGGDWAALGKSSSNKFQIDNNWKKITIDCISNFDLNADFRMPALYFGGFPSGTILHLGALTIFELPQTLSQKDYRTSLSEICFKTGEYWKPIDTSSITVESGSALDLSAMNDAPAGKYGRVVVGKNGELVFTHRQQAPLRFLGFNWIYGRGGVFAGNDEATIIKNIEIFAKLTARQGYNIVRLHCIDGLLRPGRQNGDFSIPDYMWKRFDYLMECFRRNGIYVYLDLGLMGIYCNADGKICGGMREKLYWNIDNVRDEWKSRVLAILNHVSPWNNTALKDDPMVVCVLFFNEQDLPTMPWRGYHGDNNLIWQENFRIWLKNKYKSLESLKSSWGNDADKNWIAFADIPFNGTEKVPSGIMRNDMSLFYFELQNNMLDYYKSVMKECGYKGLTTHNDVIKNKRGTAVRAYVDIISQHDYAAHPSNKLLPGSKIGVNSSIFSTMWYWRSINQTRILGKPLMVTEYAQAHWNPYVHEAGVAFPAYSSFQNFSGIMVHSDAVALSVDKALFDGFTHYNSPIMRANEFIAAHLFRRGDVKHAQGLVAVKLSEDSLFCNGEAENALNSMQASMALVTGFGVEYNFAGTTPLQRNPNVTLAPVEGGALIVSTEYTSTAIDSNNDDNALKVNRDVLDTLKKQKIISSSNLTDFSKKIYQSDTGQIYLDAEKSLLKVTTLKSEAVCMKPGYQVKLSCLSVQSTSVPATIAAIAIDGKNLIESSRIILVYSTNTANSGMTLSADGTTLLNQGELPLLLECGKVELSLENHIRKMELWALGLDGSRREIIPINASANQKHIAIDTAILKNGPTPFFELVEK